MPPLPPRSEGRALKANKGLAWLVGGAVRDLAIEGREVMEILGTSPGPGHGRILKTLLEEVLENPERNTTEYLGRRVRELGRGDAQRSDFCAERAGSGFRGG